MPLTRGRLTKFTMWIILVIFVVDSFRVLNCEWIEISQPIRRSNGIGNNRSMSNADLPTNFDYSTYKDFFSIIEPDIDFANPIEPFNPNIVDKFEMDKKLMEKDFHVLINRGENLLNINKNEVPLNTSKISIFSAVGGTKNHFVIKPLKVDPMLSSTQINDSNDRVKIQSDNVKFVVTEETTKDEQINKKEERPENHENRVVLKRVEFKPFDFKGVLKSIQQSFPLNAFASIREKMTFLECFINDLIANIEERFKLLWSVDQGKRRIRRSESNHGVEFPTSEVALMTISFLTLAVFLIKLVLQVIHTIKSKHVGYQTMMTPAAGNDSAIKIIKANRNARKLSTIDDLRAVTEAISSIEQNVNTDT